MGWFIGRATKIIIDTSRSPMIFPTLIFVRNKYLKYNTTTIVSRNTLCLAKRTNKVELISYPFFKKLHRITLQINHLIDIKQIYLLSSNHLILVKKGGIT